MDAAAPSDGEGLAVSTEPTTGALWPMPTPSGAGLDHERHYVVAGEVVQDAVTGLTWQRSVAQREYFTWSEALERCESLELGGYEDWRLPSRIELVSLLSLEVLDPSIDQQAFPETPSDWFWTSTTNAGREDEAWYVYFYFGYPNTDLKTSAFSVRCVRSEPVIVPVSVGEGRYEIAEQVIVDRWTALDWQREIAEEFFTFEDAGAYCDGLELGARSDWRTPTVLELQTLVDASAFAPAIDLVAFPGTPARSFWSSTPWVEAPDLRGFYVDFEKGSALYLIGTTPFNVRCVAAHR